MDRERTGSTWAQFSTHLYSNFYVFQYATGISGAHAHYFNEIVVFSTNLIHVFIRSKRKPEHAGVFICRASANIGMVLVRSRSSMQNCENFG